VRGLSLRLLITIVTAAAIQLAVPSGIHATSPVRADFIQGADISSLPAIEDHGGVFKENGAPKDPLLIFQDHGLNYIRLRIWHTPAAGYANLEKTLQIAVRIKSLGFKLLLDVHYSDTWADPGHQTKPAAWESLPFAALRDSVFQYTRDVITALKNQNTLPDMVQIGNEIICGMLWNDGRVCDPFNTPRQWTQLAELIGEGIHGVNESLSADDTVQIMIHIDRGGDNGGSRWFYDHLLAQNVDFDIIGLSYYPWWHGTLSDLEFNTHDLAGRYGKDIVIVETAYPWTLDWCDDSHNIVGNSSHQHPGYPATVEGQTDFLNDLIDLIQGIPGNKGMGLFYWAPEWISAPGLGSPWENVTLFDFSGELLNSISAFDSTLSGASSPDKAPRCNIKQ
jgi:arabinogalactan endo-1,4-beta-galactosidase